MNWDFLIGSALAFSLLFVVVLTIGFIINYKRDQQHRHQIKKLDPNKGRYFLRAHYIEQETPVTESSTEVLPAKSQGRKFGRRELLQIAPYAVFAILLVSFVTLNFHRFFSQVSLDAEELSRIPYKLYEWVEWQDPSVPEWHEISSRLRSTQIVFLKSRRDEVWFAPDSQRNLTQEVESAWSRWAANLGVQPKNCLIENWRSCLSSSKRNILIVFPGYWPVAEFDKILSTGAALLLSGPPAQIFQEGRQVFEWNKLVFERSGRERLAPIIFRADQRLSLGWNAGQILDLHPISKSYRALYQEPDAYRPVKRSQLRGPLDAGLASGVMGPGRWVWGDFWPERHVTLAPIEEESMQRFQASVFRYLLGDSYKTVATWPNAKSFAYFFGLSVVGPLNKLGQAVPSKEAWQTHALVTSLYGRSALEDWSTTRDLAGAGELACLGGEVKQRGGESLLAKTQDLALCAKMIHSVTEARIVGFRPPNAEYDTSLLSAALNTQYRYVMIGNSLEYVTPQLLEDEEDHSSIVLLGRMNSSDQEFFDENGRKDIDPERIWSEEVAWIEKIGGLFAGDFHAVQWSNERRDSMLRLAERMKQLGGMAIRPAELAEWWRVRAKLTEGVEASAEEMKRFQPYLVKVDANGEIQKLPLHGVRELSSKDEKEE